MKKGKLLLYILIFCFSFLKSFAQKPDTVRTGIYITSIHDIDFRQKEYTINFWIWFKYKNRAFDFVKYLEIPQAKEIKTLYSAVDDTSEKNKIYVLMKLQCVMKNSWKIDNFPLNKQNLWLTIENAQFPDSMLVFAKDTLRQIYDKHALMDYGIYGFKGWYIKEDSVKISIGTKKYETTFGDAFATTPLTVYSVYRVKIGIDRDTWGLFWKIFLGMYVAFLIAYVSFYIHADNIDARFSLTVGALFAVIGNKYIIESALPESPIFTLVDALHGVTLFFIFSVMVSTIYVLRLNKKHKMKEANRFDMIIAQLLLLVYIALNLYFIFKGFDTYK